MNDLNQIAQALISEMGSYCDMTGICRQVLLLLAKGQPVTVEEIATALRISRDDVINVLRQYPDVQYDNEGRITGKGLTLTSTPHRFLVNGHTLFTWCALDALMYPAILQQSVRVESPCVVTNRPVNLTVTPSEVKNVAPVDTVVSIVIPEHSEVCCNVRDAFCNHVNFFSSREAASIWLMERPSAFILSVNEAYQIGRTVAAYIYQQAT